MLYIIFWDLKFLFLWSTMEFGNNFFFFGPDVNLIIGRKNDNNGRSINDMMMMKIFFFFTKWTCVFIPDDIWIRIFFLLSFDSVFLIFIFIEFRFLISAKRKEFPNQKEKRERETRKFCFLSFPFHTHITHTHIDSFSLNWIGTWRVTVFFFWFPFDVVKFERQKKIFLFFFQTTIIYIIIIIIIEFRAVSLCLTNVWIQKCFQTLNFWLTKTSSKDFFFSQPNRNCTELNYVFSCFIHRIEWMNEWNKKNKEKKKKWNDDNDKGTGKSDFRQIFFSFFPRIAFVCVCVFACSFSIYEYFFFYFIFFWLSEFFLSLGKVVFVFHSSENVFWPFHFISFYFFVFVETHCFFRMNIFLPIFFPFRIKI